jgi:hypothetical protein
MSLSSELEDRQKYYDEFHAKHPPYQNNLWTTRDRAPPDFELYKVLSQDEKRALLAEGPLISTVPAHIQ